MTTGMKLSYYPGCTLKSKARNLEEAALGALEELGIEYQELPRWNCCGAVFSLADDDLIHHVAPVRNLIRAMEQGSDVVVTLCSQCYNVLARANQLVREDEEKRKTLNLFMTEEPDYNGEVEVQHLLPFLRDHLGWDALKEKVKVPLGGLKVATFYGCTLLRPESVAVNTTSPELFEDFLRTLGADPVPFPGSQECCGAYESLVYPDVENQRAAKLLKAVDNAGAEAMVLSCPLCEYNLGTRQPTVLEQVEGVDEIPAFYFTQLLAIALGLPPEVCQLRINGNAAIKLLQEKELIAAAPA
jgi:heterodisulfide reductase subunit B